MKVNMKIVPEWASLIRRVKAEVDDTVGNNRSDGVAIITMTVAFTAQGKPLGWVVSEGRRVEPSSKARDLVLALSLAGAPASGDVDIS